MLKPSGVESAKQSPQGSSPRHYPMPNIFFKDKSCDLFKFVSLLLSASRELVSPVCGIFKASALWADAFYKSKCPSVCLWSVCGPSVCSLLRYRLTVFSPPLPEVGCLIFVEIWNPWGKVMERSGLRLEHFSLEVV